MQNDVVAVTIKGVMPTANGCAVFLGNEDKTFVIYVDHSVGNAIQMTLSGVKKDRPLTHDLIGNAKIANFGSENIFLNAVNWSVDRDTQLNIAARPIEQFQLSLSAGDFAKLRYSLLLVLPGAVAVLGILVYWNRRH